MIPLFGAVWLMKVIYYSSGLRGFEIVVTRILVQKLPTGWNSTI
jgi:hypothetical protein